HLRLFQFLLLFVLAPLFAARPASAQKPPTESCPRLAPGSAVPEPEDLRSHDGVLQVDLVFRSDIDAHGRRRYCYIYDNAVQAPNLRLNPGDVLILNLKNEVSDALGTSSDMEMSMDVEADKFCAGSMMTSASTNLHFHGLTIPPVCHQDDVLNTIVTPGG